MGAKLRSTNNLKITEGKIYKDSVDDIENVDYDEGDDVLEVIGNTRMSPMSEIVLAQYSADGEWYKASIIKKDLANKRVFVSYTDFYGSEEWIDYPQKIKPYDPSSDILYEAEDEFEIIGSLETNGCTKGMSLNGELNEMENGMITQEGDIDVVQPLVSNDKIISNS